MQSFFISVNAVMPVLILAGIGVFIRKKQLLSDHTFSEMNMLCFKLFLPAMILYNIYTSEFSMSYAKLVVFALAMIVAAFIVLCLIVPLFVKESDRKGVVVQAIFRGNYILLGVPVATVICGEGNVGPVALAAAFVVPLFNFLAVIALSIYNDKKTKINWKVLILNILKNPLIGASAIGLALVFLNVDVPVFIVSTVRDLGRVATSLSLVVLGGSLALEGALGNKKTLVAGSFVRLVILPLVMVLIAIWVGFRGPELVSILLIFGTPTAVSSFVMAEQMGCDGELAAEFVMTTSVASLGTMFVWIFVLSSMGLI